MCKCCKAAKVATIYFAQVPPPNSLFPSACSEYQANCKNKNNYTFLLLQLSHESQIESEHRTKKVAILFYFQLQGSKQKRARGRARAREREIELHVEKCVYNCISVKLLNFSFLSGPAPLNDDYPKCCLST